MLFAESDVFTVADINELVRELVEENFPDVAVVGEVSNFRRHSSGHLYFTLKDEQAQLRGVCFRSSARRLEVDVADGMRVVARGRLTVYPGYGQYQLVADTIEEAGEGSLEVAFRRLKARLEAEGLFDPAHKVPLPRFPGRIAVVTSPTGAAIRDILSTLRRRWPCVEVILVPVRVQGDPAAGEVAGAIELLGRARGIDLVIVGRGGGSLEDLWAFNEEVVARAIYACPIPVISAVGHESDVTISDLVADVRAATPTMAAEIAVPIRDEVAHALDHVMMRLAKDMGTRISLERHRLSEMLRSHALGKIRGRIENAMQRVDHTVESLERAARAQVELPGRRLEQALARLGALDPRAVLARGFALCTEHASGRVLASRAAARDAGHLEITFHDGAVPAVVEEEANEQKE